MRCQSGGFSVMWMCVAGAAVGCVIDDAPDLGETEQAELSFSSSLNSLSPAGY